MTVWRIRFAEKDGRERAFYHEQSMMPSMAEAEAAVHCYLLYADIAKDAAPLNVNETALPAILSIDKLPE